MRQRDASGYTLVEILTVVAIIGVLAGIAVPALWAGTPARLDVAAQEAANAVRFAGKEAERTGRHVLVDAQSLPGHLRLRNSDAAGADLGALADPLTKRAFDLDVAGSAFSAEVVLAARFMQGGTAYARLLVAPTGDLEVFDGAVSQGPLEPGSGIVLFLDSNSVTVAIDETTGRVSLP